MGKVYLVGAGPGAPDLLTLRAARILEAADIVLHDALVHPDTLKLATKARFIDVGKRYGKISTEQRVVRLKGGDPMIFARAQEELDALRAEGIETEVVPGVTAALAAAAVLQVSLTRRGVARTVSILTPRVGRDETSSEWLPAALAADSVVLYMAAGASQEIARALLEGGKPGTTPVALVESATLPEERRLFTTLAGMRALELPRAGGPVVMCVGEVFHDRAMADIALERCRVG
jgi:uroporphyrin-III C-methyltransferase